VAWVLGQRLSLVIASFSEDAGLDSTEALFEQLSDLVHAATELLVKQTDELLFPIFQEIKTP